MSESEVLEALARQLRIAVGAPIALYRKTAGGTIEPIDADVHDGPGRDTLTRAWEEMEVDRTEADGWSFFQLRSVRGTLALVAVAAIPAGDNAAGFVRSLCHQAALALERILLADELAEARLVSETEQLRSALLSSVSHDLRTPLASIIGATSSVLDLGENLSESDRRELLATALHEARRLDRYIQNLLDMTRLGHGGIELCRDWVDVSDLIGSAQARLRASGEELPPIEVSIDPAVPMLWVHGALIEQALVNLLDNAARFSPPGGSVAIRVHRHDDHLELSICDQGPGIPAHAREKVFDMFYSAREGDRSAHQGTGLGLAICRGLIGAHGGTIEATSGREDRGTCMIMCLPLNTPGEAKAT